MIKAYQSMIRAAADQVRFDAPVADPPPKTLWTFLRWSVKGGQRVIWMGVLISVLAGVTDIAAMALLGDLVDATTATTTGFWVAHWDLVLLSLFVLLVARPVLFGGLALTQSVMIGPNIGMQSLARLFRWTLGQSVSFFDNDFAGRIAQKMQQTTNSLTEMIVESVNALIFGLASILATALLLSTINAWMLLVLGGWFAVYLLFLRVMLPIIRGRSSARAEKRAMVTGQVVDTISNVKTVKLFAGDTHEDGKAIGAMAELRDTTLRFGEVQTIFRFGLILIAGFLPVMLLAMAISLRNTGVTPGEVAAIGAVSIRLSQMTGWISFTLMVIYSHMGEVEDGIETLAPANRIEDAPDATALTASKGEIAFDRVTFAYGRQTGGVTDLSLTIQPGEKIGLVGASGAGKSTLVGLLMRLYDTEGGTVRIDGQDVSKVSQDSLRAQVGMVTQDTAMFNRTALDNIRYGRPDASRDEVVAAAVKAEAHDFLLDLKDHMGRTGYDAFLGERGVKLSGGQRQRVAIARVILKDAPILVLDEATSALDSEVEAAIQETLSTMMQGKTVIAIAHRLSTIAQMDRIIVLEQGQIAEQGTHDELLAQKGLYAGFWARQSGGFLATEAAE